MKLTPRFILRAGLVLSAAGAIGAFGACRDKGPTPPPIEPPPPPGAPAAPTNVTLNVVSDAVIDVSWTDASTNEDGFKVESCSGAGCTNFAEVGSVAANVTAFSNTGLAENTDYSYRVSAFNANGAAPSTAVGGKTRPKVAPPAGVVMIGAGEITSCNVGGLSGATAALVQAELAKNPNAIVFTAGNNLNAPAGPGTNYTNCFDPTWGKFKDKGMRVALGQDDYESVNTEAIYGYFGDRAGAPNGWYSFDPSPTWHVIVLNTTTWQHGTCNLAPTPESHPECAGQPMPMIDFLSQDLAKAVADGKKCTMVISWERRFYAGTGATFMNSNMRTITHMLQDAGTELIVSAKDKLYARFAPQTYLGAADPNGVRQFIVGTGGRSLDGTPANRPTTLEVLDNSTHGVLKLTLNEASYDWEFVPTTAGGFTDKGTTNCH